MIERIPTETLEAARLKFKRRCAAMLLLALADSGETVKDCMARLEQGNAHLWDYIKGLGEGSVKCGDEAVDLATAMDRELVPQVQMFPRPPDRSDNRTKDQQDG